MLNIQALLLFVLVRHCSSVPFISFYNFDHPQTVDEIFSESTQSSCIGTYVVRTYPGKIDLDPCENVQRYNVSCIIKHAYSHNLVHVPDCN